MKPAARNVLILLLVCLAGAVAHAQQATRPATVATTPAATTAAAVADGGPRVYMTNSAGDYWVAVSRPTGKPDAPHASVVYFRDQGADKFSVVARLPGRVAALTRWAGRTAVLLEDGQWLNVWNGGSSTGLSLPTDGRILTIAGDDDSLWAVAAVPGGLDATRAATRPVATTSSTATTVAALRAAQPVLVLFELDGNAWTPRVTLPSNLAASQPITVSLVVLGDRLDVAVGRRGGPSELFTIDRGAVTALPVDGDTTLQLLTGPKREPLAWARHPDGTDELLRVAPDGLTTVATLPPTVISDTAAATIGSAFGYLRVLVVGDDIVEQRLSPDGKPVGEPTTLKTLPPPDEAPPWMEYMQGVILALLALAIFSSLRHRDAVREALARRDRPRPARIWIRLCAAAVDALPMFVGIAYAYLRARPGEFTTMTLSSKMPEIIGIGIYLGHTLVSELIFRRTLGKAIFGLKVVSLTGDRPTVGAIVIRNLLRVIDIALLIPFLLPILLLLFSPLRQRAGDAAAGTMVIDLAAPTMTDETEADRVE